MLNGEARYYIDRLAEEHVRLINAASNAAEDAALAKIDFYRAKLNGMGIRYDEATRCWIVKDGPCEQLPQTPRVCPEDVDREKSAADWELHFHENGRELGKRVALSTSLPDDLLKVIQSEHCNVEVWRDGRLVCTVFQQ